MLRILLAIAVLGLAACTSPEATRARGGGPGADVGNRGEVVRMHGGSMPFHETPRLLPMEPGPVEPARHAMPSGR